MTVGELRRRMAEMSDDAEVKLSVYLSGSRNDLPDFSANRAYCYGEKDWFGIVGRLDTFHAASLGWVYLYTN